MESGNLYKESLSEPDYLEDEDLDSFKSEPVAEVALGNVSNVIDKLYRLSFKIRNPATRHGFSKAKDYRDVDASTGVDLIEQFALIDQSHVQEVVAHYRGIPPGDCKDDFLVCRLARANTSATTNGALEESQNEDGVSR